MKRAAWITLVASGVAAVAAGLGREAWGLEARAAGTLLLALFAFLTFEWAAHLIGSRLLQPFVCSADPRFAVRTARGLRRRRLAVVTWAAHAALSATGIWIALLVLVPPVLGLLGLSPSSVPGILVMAAASAAGLWGRLWFLREIYQTRLDRAAVLWAASRAAAVLVACAGVAVYAAASALAGACLPALSAVW